MTYSDYPGYLSVDRVCDDLRDFILRLEYLDFGGGADIEREVGDIVDELEALVNDYSDY